MRERIVYADPGFAQEGPLAIPLPQELTMMWYARLWGRMSPMWSICWKSKLLIGLLVIGYLADRLPQWFP